MDYQEPFSTRIYESSINYLMINYLIARDIRERPHFLTSSLPYFPIATRNKSVLLSQNDGNVSSIIRENKLVIIKRIND